MTIDEAFELWDEAYQSIVPTVGECMKEHASEVIELNKKQLYETGKNANGELLREYWDVRHPQASHLGMETYSEIKNRMNPLPGYGQPDLYLTGDFQKGFVLSVTDDSYEITSTDKKAAILISDGAHGYGETIMGLDEDNSSELWNETLNDSYTDKLREQTGAE